MIGTGRRTTVGLQRVASRLLVGRAKVGLPGGIQITLRIGLAAVGDVTGAGHQHACRQSPCHGAHAATGHYGLDVARGIGVDEDIALRGIAVLAIAAMGFDLAPGYPGTNGGLQQGHIDAAANTDETATQ